MIHQTRTQAITTINPATGEVLRQYTPLAARELDDAIRFADRAYRSWRDTHLDVRCAVLKRAAALLRERAGEYAALMTAEMGKPIEQARGEAEKCAWVCDHYADNAERYLARLPIETDASASYVSFQPLGVLLAIMPWNFPFWQVFRFAAPALVAGNAALLKHASNTIGCGLAIEKLWRDAGVPESLMQALVIGREQVESVIRHDLVRGVTLTGSPRAGRDVAAKAGAALKKTVLELGGSDPYLVFADADLVHAAEVCARSRLVNSGQSCIAAKRFIVVDRVKDRFQALLIQQLRDAEVGPPEVESTDVGPMAREDLRDKLHEQVVRSADAGARIELGGAPLDRAGFWYPPTVLTNVEPGMPAYDEETFGPVAAVIPVRDEAQAVAVANDSSYGLGAAVFTRDRERGERVAEQMLEAGYCAVNGQVKSDPRLPFGGIKGSGYGRELGSFGIRELVNIKTVRIDSLD